MAGAVTMGYHYFSWKFEFEKFKHPKPYKLQWSNDCGEIKINKQVFFSFSIKKYKV